MSRQVFLNIYSEMTYFQVNFHNRYITASLSLYMLVNVTDFCKLALKLVLHLFGNISYFPEKNMFLSI